MRRLTLLLLLVFASACGGDESGELTRTEYTKRANASCAKAEKTLTALGGFAGFKELEREMKLGRDALNEAADELRELQPPSTLLPNHRKLIDLTEQTAELAGRLSAAAGKNDQLEMQRQAERAEKLTTSANDVARKLGVLDCVAG